MSRTGNEDLVSRFSMSQAIVDEVANQLTNLPLHEFRMSRTILVACIASLTANVLPELNKVVKEDNFNNNNVAKEKPESN